MRGRRVLQIPAIIKVLIVPSPKTSKGQVHGQLGNDNLSGMLEGHEVIEETYSGIKSQVDVKGMKPGRYFKSLEL